MAMQVLIYLTKCNVKPAYIELIYGVHSKLTDQLAKPYAIHFVRVLLSNHHSGIIQTKCEGQAIP